MLRSELINIPKAELHVHIEAIATDSTILELARKQNILNAELEEKVLNKTKNFGNIQSFFDLWHIYNGMLRSPEDFERVLYEYLQESSELGVRYNEININVMRQLQKGLELQSILEALYSAQKQAENLGIYSRTILSYSRDFSLSDAKMITDAVEKYKHWNVVGFDIAGDEKRKPNSLFKDVFVYAREKGINYTVHAGEGALGDSLKVAISDFGAKRIAHAVDLINYEELIDEILQQDILIELCLTSNQALGFTPDITNHPAILLKEKDVRFSINTDDPALLGINILDEFQKVSDLLNLEKFDLEKIYESTISSSFAQTDLKKQLLDNN